MPVVSEIPKEIIPDFESWGIRAFVTTRDAGTFSLSSTEPVHDVMGRWSGFWCDCGGRHEGG